MNLKNAITLLITGAITFAAAHPELIPPPYNAYAMAGIAVLSAVYHLYQNSPSQK